MATVTPRTARLPVNLADYPTGDGKPVGETPIHRDNLLYTVYMLREHFAADEMTYVSGNMLMYYVEGDNRRHVSPDVFVVRGIPNTYRDSYKTWEEGGKGPDVVIEMTSPSTRNEDLEKKFQLYRDVLKVREYFLYDPRAEYLDPQLQGHRLIEGQYVRIEPVVGDRLVSEVLGLHFESLGRHTLLRVYDPVKRRWLMDPEDISRVAAIDKARNQELEVEVEFLRADRERAEADRERAEADRERAEADRERAEAEQARLAQELANVEVDRQRLLAELEALRRQPPPASE